MAVDVDIYFTLALAAALLVLGARIVASVGFLSRYAIPDAVVGGMLAAVALTVGRSVGRPARPQCADREHEENQPNSRAWPSARR